MVKTSSYAPKDFTKAMSYVNRLHPASNMLAAVSKTMAGLNGPIRMFKETT